MRLWSLSPAYLDVKGLLAVWRESLLARAVLMEQTRGYLNHPQLARFKAHPDPLTAVNYYLERVYSEAVKRGYHFDSKKISLGLQPKLIAVTQGQVDFEVNHLKKKLLQRDPYRLALLANAAPPILHPLFYLVPGPIEAWERV